MVGMVAWKNIKVKHLELRGAGRGSNPAELRCLRSDLNKRQVSNHARNRRSRCSKEGTYRGGRPDEGRNGYYFLFVCLWFVDLMYYKDDDASSRAIRCERIADLLY